MRYLKRWQTVFVCLVALALLAVAPARRGHARVAAAYSVTDLGTLGGSQSKAFGLDNCGRVVGNSWPTGSSSDHPFLWSDDNANGQSDPGEMKDLGTLGGDNGTAFSMNGAGYVVGTAAPSVGDTHGFLWSSASGMKDIGGAEAFTINNAGQVGGATDAGANDLSVHAFVWSQAAGLQVVPASGGLTPSYAEDINGAGSVVGTAALSDFTSHAYLLSGGVGGTLIDLGTFGGPFSWAFAVNGTGQVVGYSHTAGGLLHAFVWHDDNGNHISDAGEMKDLGTLSGGSNSIAYDINASGLVVGYSEITNAAEHAFVYDAVNGMRDLNTLIPASPSWTLQEARAVNDRGQIVGYGLISGQTHAFLLTPNNVSPAPCSATSVTNVSGSGAFNGPATLTAKLTTSGGSALTGKAVSFTLNGSAVCGVGGAPACPTTDASGVATLSGVSISGINVGSYANAVGASFVEDASDTGANNTGPLTVNKADQTISFGALSNKTFGDADFSVSATGGASGNPVTFSAVGNCTLSNASTVHITGAGTCTVTASQAGDSSYNAAPDVSQSFQIAKASQTISFGALSDRRYGSMDFPVTATGGASSNPVTFSATGNCTILNGNTVHITGVGSCSVTASQAGDSNYSAAPSVTQSFQIRKVSTFMFLHASPNPSAVGQQVTFIADVRLDSLTPSDSSAVPTGTVQFQVDFKDVGGPVNCAPIGGNTCSAGGVSTSAMTAGFHGITAKYSGDANFNPSSIMIPQQVGSAFNFSQFNYTVSERGGSVTITVNRTGDTSGAASVDYSTDDASTPSVAVPCSSVTGIALERCDYTRAAGTLNFAAGETQKTFTVLVNDDSYTEGTETVSLKLSNPLGAVLDTASTATLQITDDSPESSGNPVDDASFFVTQHYHDFLNREPDTSGLQFWSGGITTCGADTNCRDVKRVDTSAAFFLSIEFQETGYLVERIYKTAYGDATGSSTFPSAHTLAVPVVRLDEFLIDTQRIGRGVVVGQGAWQQQIEDNKNAFATEFVQRQRFAAAYPSSLSAEAFVNQLNTNAGGVLTDSDKAQLEALFGGPASSSNDAARRASVLRQVAENPVLNAAEKNRAFVLMQFFGYLRRNPNDAQDTDYTGYDFWLQKLNQFGGDFVQAEMVKAFISSTEYRQRFGQP